MENMSHPDEMSRAFQEFQAALEYMNKMGAMTDEMDKFNDLYNKLENHKISPKDAVSKVWQIAHDRQDYH